MIMIVMRKFYYKKNNGERETRNTCLQQFITDIFAEDGGEEISRYSYVIAIFML